MEETSSFWPKEETAEKSFLTWSLSNIKDKTMKKLFSILMPHDNWDNNTGDEDNLKAKQALHEFYKELAKAQPEEEYREARISKPYYSHSSYLSFLVRIKEALMEEKYMRACNELVSLMYYEPYLQGRIYYNILKMLKGELGAEGIELQENPIDFPTEEFENVMRVVKLEMETEKNFQDKLIILDFILEAIKEDLKTDLLSHIIYSQPDFEREFKIPFPFFYKDEQGNRFSLKKEGLVEVSLSESCILTLPWRWNKLSKQAKNLFSNDFVYSERNHIAYYFPYVDICYVVNGKHSISAGTIYKKGTIKAEQYDITKLFPHIHTDGQSWYNSHTHEKKNNLPDFRIGIIYEVAKIKYQLVRA